MKRLIALFLISLFIVFAAACKKADTEAVDLAPGASAAPALSPAPTDASAGGESETPSYGSRAEASVTATAAYVYAGLEGTTLYGAAEYKNSGDCPIYVSSASFAFTVDGVRTDYDFTPALAEHMIVLPGETAYLPVWLVREDIAPGAEVSLSARVNAEKCEDSRIDILADNLYIADNYPGFSTLSGRLVCEEGSGCSMNMVFVGFYDAAGKFLGAWYFSKNALLEGGDEKNFVVNMQDFPVESLASIAASASSIAFGFEL